MRIYLIIAVVVAVLGIFWAGGEIAKQKCRAETAKLATEHVVNINKTTNKIKRDANEKTFNTGVDDIRHILYQKYTIAE